MPYRFSWCERGSCVCAALSVLPPGLLGFFTAKVWWTYGGGMVDVWWRYGGRMVEVWWTYGGGMVSVPTVVWCQCGLLLKNCPRPGNGEAYAFSNARTGNLSHGKSCTVAVSKRRFGHVGRERGLRQGVWTRPGQWRHCDIVLEPICCA